LFECESPEHLARLMGEWWEKLPPGPELQQEAIAIETAHQEVQEFGCRFLEIAKGSI
jgi:hypothetical protein